MKMYYLVVWWMTRYSRTLKKGDVPYPALFPDAMSGQHATVHHLLGGAIDKANELVAAHPDDLVQIYDVDSERVMLNPWKARRAS
jgi:hypothetical protein